MITTRLTMFFLLFTFLVTILYSLILTTSLHWAEDVMQERRLEVEFQEAIAEFQKNPTQKTFPLNSLTTAYFGRDIVPQKYQSFIPTKKPFLKEFDIDKDIIEGETIYIYGDYFQNANDMQSLILVSHIESLDMTWFNYFSAVALVLLVTTLSYFLFKGILNRMSKSLINPIESLKTQLNTNHLEIGQEFSVPQESAVEFQLLTDKLNEYTKEINALLKREQSFARYASHELRTPLTVIKGSLCLLEKRLTEPFEKRQLASIKNACVQTSNIVDLLLSLVRYEKSRKEEDTFHVTKAHLDTIILKYQDMIKNKSIELKLRIKEDFYINAPLIVFEIVLGNILRNAIQAMQEGTISIDIENNILTVHDEGMGLNTLEQNNTYEGYGLGCMIIEDLCTRYHWKFTLENHAEKGCVATVEFPVI